MNGSKIWSAEELERMTPSERQAIVRAGFETHLTTAPPSLIERARRRIEAHIADNRAIG